MKTLSRAEKDSLDEELFMYNRIAYEIALRKLELDTQKEYDDNIGGGRSNRVSKVVESTVIRYDMDNRIQYLERLRKDIESCYKNLTEEQQKIFDLRWLLDEGNSWPEIGDKLTFDRSTIYRKREMILKIYAKQKGIR